MLHVSYGLFEDSQHAQAAVERIEASGVGRRCHVDLQKGAFDEGQGGLAETGSAQTFRAGAAAGVVLGAAAGAIVVGPIGMLSGAAVGGMYGAFAGVLVGAGGPERALSRLSKHLTEGKVLVIVEAPSFECRDLADALMLESGAQVEHRSLL
jgi:uncharacterized membrane protein